MKLFVATKVFIVREGKVLLIREAKYDEGTNTGKWDIPGGRLEEGENLMEGLKREVKEEVGLQVSNVRILDVHETNPTIKGESAHIVRVYYTAEASGEIVLSSDHDAFDWVNPADLGDKSLMTDMQSMLVAGLKPTSHIKSAW